MSRFVKQTTIRNISFEPDHPLHGLEMRTRGADVRFMARLAGVFTELQATGQAGVESGSATQEEMNRVADLIDHAYGMFASKLVSWNMQDEDGNEIAPTVEGFHTLDDDEFVMGAVRAWLEVVAGVSPDLGKDSGSGETSQALSLPMDVLSPSLAN